MGLTAAARISAAVTRGILYGKGFAKPCIQFFADGTYRLRPTRSCCLVTRSWEPMLFNVREPIRIIYLLLFSLVGCRAPPPRGRGTRREASGWAIDRSGRTLAAVCADALRGV